MNSLLLSTGTDSNISIFENIIEKNNIYMFHFFISKYPSFLNNQDNLYKFLFICLERSINENMSLLFLNLYSEKINYNYKNNISQIPLICYAALHKKWLVVRYLLLHGADANQRCSNNISLLSILINHKQCILIELLFEHYNVSVNEKNENGIPIIFDILDKRLYNISNYMFNEGIDVNCLNAEGVSLLEVVIKKGLFLHSKYILENGGGTIIYNNEKLFHKFVDLAILNNSTLIANRLILNYFATIIQRRWRHKLYCL